jgi:hypothetical protein
MNPQTVYFCQPIQTLISARVAPFLRCSMATTRAALVPSRGPTLCRPEPMRELQGGARAQRVNYLDLWAPPDQ